MGTISKTISFQILISWYGF